MLSSHAAMLLPVSSAGGLGWSILVWNQRAIMCTSTPAGVLIFPLPVLPYREAANPPEEDSLAASSFFFSSLSRKDHSPDPRIGQ